MQLVGLGKRIEHDHFVPVVGFEPASTHQVEVVQRRSMGDRDGHQTTCGGFRQTRNVEGHLGHHPSLQTLDPWDGGDLGAEPAWCALARGEHVGEPIASVVLPLGEVQGVERRQHENVHGHAGGDHGCDRQHLAFDAPQITDELAVESCHQSTSVTTRYREDADGP